MSMWVTFYNESLFWLKRSRLQNAQTTTEKKIALSWISTSTVVSNRTSGRVSIKLIRFSTRSNLIKPDQFSLIRHQLQEWACLLPILKLTSASTIQDQKQWFLVRWGKGIDINSLCVDVNYSSSFAEGIYSFFV